MRPEMRPKSNVGKSVSDEQGLFVEVGMHCC